MNDEISKQLLEWAQQAIKYGQTIIPVIVDQYLTWWTIAHILGILLGLGIAGSTYFLFRYFGKRKDSDDCYDDEGWIIVRVLTATTGPVAAALVLFSNVYYLVKIQVAPAVYIIDALMTK